jgi:hypothetical protein
MGLQFAETYCVKLSFMTPQAHWRLRLAHRQSSRKVSALSEQENAALALSADSTQLLLEIATTRRQAQRSYRATHTKRPLLPKKFGDEQVPHFHVEPLVSE